MALRLSSSPPMGGGTPQSHLNAFLEGDATDQQKVDCLKLLNIVLKNLNDPVKAAEPKYRQLKLDNAKVQAKLVQFPSAMSFLTSVGFVRTTDGDIEVLRMDQVPTTSLVTASIVSDALQSVQISLSRLQPAASLKRDASASAPQEKLSEKQKARRLLEQKEQEDRELAKQLRKKTSDLIKKDKYVRENDENWTSQPSAACAKSGSSISTFRDKYGE